MYITAPPVNYSILCISSIVHIVAFVNLLLKKMVVVVECIMKTTGKQTMILSDIVEDREQWRELVASGIHVWLKAAGRLRRPDVTIV